MIVVRYFCFILISCTFACVAQKNQYANKYLIDQDKITAQANQLLSLSPQTITSYKAVRSIGGIHDYYSEGPYWWPNPEDLNGPYIRKDGYRNPEYFKDHNAAIGKFGDQMSTLTAAHIITKNNIFADKAITHLNAWFIDSETRMNPHLLYGQAIKGLYTGRGIGLIDVIELIDVANACRYLEREGLLKGKELVDIKAWFTQFATWMTTHPYGIDERDNNNNHSTWWGAQVAAYGQFIGDEKIIDIAREQFKRQLDIQLAEDGSFPDELSRTRPYHYTLYNLDAWSIFALQISSSSSNFGLYESKNGSIRRAIDFLIPYIKNQKEWTLLTGLEPKFEPEVSDYSLYSYWMYGHQEYLDLWSNNRSKTNDLKANILVLDKLLHP